MDKWDYFKNRPQDLIFSFILYFLFILLNMKPSPEVVPGLLVIQIQIQALWAIFISKWGKIMVIVLGFTNASLKHLTTVADES